MNYSNKKPGANITHRNSRITNLAMLFFLLCLTQSASAEIAKVYLRLDRSLPNDNDDITLTSVGGLIFQDNAESHFDLSYVESKKNGDALAIDIGGGYVFTGDVSLFMGLGGSLGYNWEQKKYITTYYPEIGVTADIGKYFGVTISARRSFDLYNVNEDFIKLGFLFRN